MVPRPTHAAAAVNGPRAPGADPHPQWTRDYRQGVEASGIARAHRAAPESVRRHLAGRRAADPLLWERRLLWHDRPAYPWDLPGSGPHDWRRWHARLLDFTASTGRLPRPGHARHIPDREALLHLWLAAQRAALRRGTLSLTRHTALARIPGWNPDRSADEAPGMLRPS